MPRSLQDQLMDLGLATEAQLTQNKPKSSPSRGKKNRSGKKPRGGKPGGQRADKPGGQRPDRQRARAVNAGPKSGARSGKPNKRQQGELTPEERAVRQQVHQLITDNHQPRGDEAQTPFHFVKGSRVKRIYVTAEQQQALSGDDLAVAAMKGRHYVIPMEIARKIRELIPQYYVSMGSEQVAAPATADNSNVDDEYAGYEVPDDLMW